MAEVFLLLVFALLIALAALWSSERQKRKELENHQGLPPIGSIADRRLWDDVNDAIRATSRDKVTKVIGDLRNGDDLDTLTPAEKDLVTEMRTQLSGVAPEAISDQWRVLTRAARNLKSLSGDMDVADIVKGALPDERDRERLKPVIEKGLMVERKGEHDWPPIINLSEAKGYSFETLKAELTPDFENKLK